MLLSCVCRVVNIFLDSVLIECGCFIVRVVMFLDILSVIGFIGGVDLLCMFDFFRVVDEIMG